MKLIIGGCRGTHPVAQVGFLRYGGETTSFLIEGPDRGRIVVDAGTGVRELGSRLRASGSIHSMLLLLTHYHLDHVTGLPSMPVIYDRRWTVSLAAPVREGHLVGEVMPRVLDKPFWPLQVEDLASRVRFNTLPGEVSARPWAHGHLRVRWCPVPHPGGCTAYRIDDAVNRTAVVIATDCEWPAATPAQRAALLRLCRRPFPANLLLMDGQYDRATYEKHRGWGHSAWEDCVDVAQRAGVGRLLVTHHDPAHDDELLARRERLLKITLPGAALAREGMVIPL